MNKAGINGGSGLMTPSSICAEQEGAMDEKQMYQSNPENILSYER